MWMWVNTKCKTQPEICNRCLQSWHTSRKMIRIMCRICWEETRWIFSFLCDRQTTSVIRRTIHAKRKHCYGFCSIFVRTSFDWNSLGSDEITCYGDFVHWLIVYVSSKLHIICIKKSSVSNQTVETKRREKNRPTSSLALSSNDINNPL